MTHEKIIKREDGSKVRVEVFAYIHPITNILGYSESVDGEATPEEILEAKLELWQKMKPE